MREAHRGGREAASTRCPEPAAPEGTASVERVCSSQSLIHVFAHTLRGRLECEREGALAGLLGNRFHTRKGAHSKGNWHPGKQWVQVSTQLGGGFAHAGHA